MKDLVNLAIYGLGTLAVILVLIFGAQIDAISSDAIGFIAIITVVIAPIAISIIIAKREKKETKDDA